METSYEVDSIHSVLLVRLSGDLTDAALIQLHAEISSHPEVKRDFSMLIDLRQASGGTVTTAGVEALSRRSMVLSPQSRRAVVVPSDFGFGMARMYDTLREEVGGGVQIFRDIDEAKRWLGE